MKSSRLESFKDTGLCFSFFFYLAHNYSDSLRPDSGVEQMLDIPLGDCFLAALVPHSLSVNHPRSADCVIKKRVSDCDVNLQPFAVGT